MSSLNKWIKSIRIFTDWLVNNIRTCPLNIHYTMTDHDENVSTTRRLLNFIVRCKYFYSRYKKTGYEYIIPYRNIFTKCTVDNSLNDLCFGFKSLFIITLFRVTPEKKIIT